MNIDRRQLALPALAVGLLSVVPALSPAFADSGDEEAVAKNVEAFRKAQIAANAEGHVDEALQQLLSQTLNFNAPYSGAAGKFIEAASQRVLEAQNTRLI